MTSELETKYRSLLTRIAFVCQRCGRDPGTVRLLAVSKTKPSGDIEAAYQLGQRDFGENYVQELVTKRAELAHLSEIRWHLIGHLQSNKVAKAVLAAHLIHTIDSVKRVEEIDRKAQAANVTLEGLIEVNVGEEPQKAGAMISELAAVVESARAAARLKLVGLMCIPPESTDAEANRPYFRGLRELGQRFELERLSMGMSHDFEVAIEEGSTDVRVGSALFGARVQP